LLVVVTMVICIAGIVVVGRARRGARGAGGEGLASRDGTHRLLTENWALVEKTARETGMSDDEIARVRANLLGLGEG
jgi:hypothetical protein